MPFNIFSNDPPVLNGINLLKRFLSDTTRKPSSDVNNAVIEMLNAHFIVPASLGTVVKIIPAWEEYSSQFDDWVKKFVEEYDFDAPIDMLDDKNYRARVALQFLLIIMKDIVENHLKDYSRSTVDEFRKPVIADMNILDVMKTYPIMLQFNGDSKALSLISTPQPKVLKLLSLPLIAAGAMGEIILSGKRILITTGTGKHLLDATLFVLSNSLNRVYYEYVLNALIGVNYANKIFIEYYMPSIMSIDMYSTAKVMVDEYMKIVSKRLYWHEIGKYISYSLNDAIRDMAAFTLAVISQYSEAGENPDLMNKLRNYLPFVRVSDSSSMLR